MYSILSESMKVYTIVFLWAQYPHPWSHMKYRGAMLFDVNFVVNVNMSGDAIAGRQSDGLQIVPCLVVLCTVASY